MSKKTPHTGWVKHKRIPWLVARCCGLMSLNNNVSRRAAKAGCEK